MDADRITRADAAWTFAPYVLLRLAGAGQADLQALKFKRSMAALAAARTNARWLAAHRAHVCDDLLYRAVGNAQGALKSGLVALRRKLHNRVEPRAGERPLLDAIPCPRARGSVLRYWSRVARQARLDQRAQLTFDAERDEKRLALVECFKGEDFNKALQAAAPTLARNLAALVRTPPPQWRKSERQTETAALRYYTRMVTKTSPFGRFGCVALGQVDMDAPSAWQCDAALAAPCTRSMLSRAWVERIHQGLCRVPEVAARLPLEVNPTCFEDGQDVRFLRPEATAQAPAYRLSRRGRLLPAIRSVLAHVVDHPGCDEAALVESLCRTAAPGSTDPARVAALVAQILRAGLLTRRIAFPSDGTDPLQALQAALQGLGLGALQPWAGALAQLGAIAERFAQASLHERHELLHEAVQAIAALNLPGDDEHPAVRRDLIFEDCWLPGTPLTVGGPFAKALAQDLGVLLELMAARDEGGTLAQLLKDVFIESHGSAGRCFNPYRFAAQYGHLLTHVDVLDERRFPNTHRIGRKSEAYLRHLAQAAAATGDGQSECELDREALRRLTSEFSALRPVGGPLSVALHLQLSAASLQALEVGDFVAVLNYTLPGHGRYFARFCDLFDPERRAGGLAQQISRRLGHVAQDGGEAVEILSVLEHNAQVHPLLTERQIVMAGERSGVDSVRQLPPAELELRHLPDSDTLRYYHRGNPLTPLYMGVLHATALPHSHSVLTEVHPAAFHPELKRLGASRDEPMWAGAGGDRPAHRRIPRLRLGRVVLQREAWWCDAAGLPRGERDDEFRAYVRVDDWRRGLGLPAECFVRFMRKSDGGPSGATTRPRSTDHKPMFVDFENPLVVRLLLAEWADPRLDSVLFEEMLPALGSSVVESGGGALAAELQVELRREAA